jgi:hypothetical protein
MLPTKRIHTTAPAGKVYDLLRRNFTWRNTDLFLLNAMVATEK